MISDKLAPSRKLDCSSHPELPKEKIAPKEKNG
jgi:hypothetical protein